MRRGIKAVLLVTGSALLVVGGGLYLASCKDTKLAEKVREVDLSEKEVLNFDFDLSVSDVEFVPTSDGTKKVVFYENDKVWHEDKVEEHTMYVVSKEEKKWWNWLSPDFSKKKIEVRLPASELGELKIKNSTGDIKVPKEYSFDLVNIDLSTGDIDYSAVVKGELSLTLSTGNVSVNDITAKSIKVKRSTGSLNMKNVVVEETIETDGSTGKTALEKVRSKNLSVKGSTGDVDLDDVVIEEAIKIKVTTGEVEFKDIDALGEIDIETSTGDVEGSLLTGKTFDVRSDTGKISVPDQTVGAPICKVRTDTGDIKITVKA